MADHDPISDEGTPNKRRRLDTAKGWDSQDDSGDELTVDDFETATLPLSHAPPKKLQYTAGQMHADLRSSSMTADRSSPPRTFVTQATQPLGHTTQPTQPLKRPYQATQTLTSDTTRRSSDVLVHRSSPPASSPSPNRPLPEPIRKAPFAKPNGILASAMAPAGTAFRRPHGIQSRPPPVDVDSDVDDPPIERSDDESQRPNSYRPNGHGTNSNPSRNENRVKDSPRNSSQLPNMSTGVFSSLMKEFGHNPSTTKPADDMISSYASSSRTSRPTAPVAPMSRVPAHNAVAYDRIEDVPDYITRKRIEDIQLTFPFETVQRCFDALAQCKGNVEDAKAWLLADEEQDAPGEDDDADELASTTPVPPKGIARTATQLSQPIRPAVKQDIKASGRTIAEKYGGSTQVRRPSVDEEDLKPRRRLQQGRKQRELSPPLSSPVQVQHPPQPLQRLKKQTIVISDDEEESDSGIVDDGDDVEESSHDTRLLKFFNECSILDLADLSAQPEDVAKLVTEKRPFTNLDEVRAISTTTAQTTKSGKKSKARPIGEKIVDTCGDVWTSYDAIDELVKACEEMAKPTQEKLKSWGVASEDGELQLTNLDDAQDSGIGTPASSCPSDDVVPRSSKETKEGKRKNKYLPQPPNMNPDCALKDYQLVGLNWLHLLWTQRISCILADDMGLGKTCQVIAFLAQLQEEKVNGCALVIVPGSTLENWLREFERFAPSLTVQPYYGSQSERTELQVMIEQNFDSIDVVVTTYDMAVTKSDNIFLRKGVDPMVCIYDEAHVLRNTQSQRYRQLMRFNPEFRILLTGTPLQNNLKELIAVLAFLMPEMFQDKKEELDYIFQHKATTKEPTENAALLSAQRIAKARSIVTPFILRRKKQQVLDLPTKHSRVEYCDMSPSQSDHYADIYEEASQFYAANAKPKTAKQTSNILMALRKAAMHPLLARRRYDDKVIEKMTDLCVKHKVFGGSDDRPDLVRAYLTGEGANALKGGDFALHQLCSESQVPALKRLALKKQPWMDSGKVVKFKELINNFAQNGDRVLVFSQFTTMMDILESVLQTLSIKFMRLDGSTNMQIRQEMIDTFTQDDSITVFMLSTRAGGAGINLAAANKVIIFDSGFNPQDDIQAENRAHRVGQTREVEVIRLVTRGTIEEQIHALGESKLALDARVAGEGAGSEGDDGKKAEKAGEQMVEQMFKDGLKPDQEADVDEKKSSVDLKDAFKDGLEAVGVKVASRQAQF